ncbi:HpcH/HpaI aldolase family protein [Phytohabitans suffuscus]|uniref:Aldolase n=1 Tax=Phytohabitans suffuscus TaxID=624315 RepID=A0A6F8YZ42_9ACTN|nr:aldolase/citrate lyase family protein [Phytohabitans suffuscus]BCB91336.1 aldolase [Phytohabitans suffuscus]
MSAAPILDRMRAGRPAIGLTVRLTRSGEIARVARASGHDFVRVDLQHSLLGAEAVGHITQTALGCGIATLVRVRSVTDPDVPALLDAGVSGIVFPDVETEEQARHCVRVCRFAPLGGRSYGGGYPLFDYRPVPPAEALPALDAATLVVCMVESVRGLANLERIAAVPGVDVIHLGVSDLLMSIGHAGETGHPAVAAAIDRVVEVATAHGRYAGCGGSPTVAHQAEAIRRGVRLLTTRNDLNFLVDGATAWADALRAAS